MPAIKNPQPWDIQSREENPQTCRVTVWQENQNFTISWLDFVRSVEEVLSKQTPTDRASAWIECDVDDGDLTFKVGYDHTETPEIAAARVTRIKSYEADEYAKYLIEKDKKERLEYDRLRAKFEKP